MVGNRNKDVLFNFVSPFSTKALRIWIGGDGGDGWLIADGARKTPLSRWKNGERTDNEGSVLLMRVSVFELLPDSTRRLRRAEE